MSGDRRGDSVHACTNGALLTGSTEWVEFDGTVVCQKVWDGRAELEQFDVDSPEKHIKIHGLTLRLYDAKSHQWRIYWANADKGALDLPPVSGAFNNGRGEFYDQEERDGRPILVRYVWSGVTTNSPHFEQSFSADWGKTWETNWITDRRRSSYYRFALKISSSARGMRFVRPRVALREPLWA
jgi:hypothetical protein